MYFSPLKYNWDNMLLAKSGSLELIPRPTAWRQNGLNSDFAVAHFPPSENPSRRGGRERKVIGPGKLDLKAPPSFLRGANNCWVKTRRRF